jgi:hypothetical protein
MHYSHPYWSVLPVRSASYCVKRLTWCQINWKGENHGHKWFNNWTEPRTGKMDTLSLIFSSHGSWLHEFVGKRRELSHSVIHCILHLNKQSLKFGSHRMWTPCMKLPGRSLYILSYHYSGEMLKFQLIILFKRSRTYSYCSVCITFGATPVFPSVVGVVQIYIWSKFRVCVIQYVTYSVDISRKVFVAEVSSPNRPWYSCHLRLDKKTTCIGSNISSRCRPSIGH